MSERTLVTFSCGLCGRDSFTVVDRNPPIPMEVVSIYDKDSEGESCTDCKACGTPFPEFKVGSGVRSLYAEVNARRAFEKRLLAYVGEYAEMDGRPIPSLELLDWLQSPEGSGGA